jgi:LPXTG-site transpeptidase (sortase) family protein
LRATDGIVAVPVEQAFTVVVGDVNDAPTFTSAPVTTAGESTLYTYNVVTTDPDGADTLAISAGSLPSWLTLVDLGNRTATLSGTPNSSQVGVHNVVLEVTDGTATALQTFDITVGNTAPQVATNGINTLADTGDGVLAEGENVKVGITQLLVTFNQDVNDPANNTDVHDVTNSANYLLVRDNGDGFQTTSCDTGASVQDIAITIDGVVYTNGGGAGPFVSTVTINGGLPLSNGNYRLYVCGTTSIVDIVDTTLELAGDGVNPGTDFVRNFTVAIRNNGGGGGGGGNTGGNAVSFSTSGLLIPVTGFAPNQTTQLPAQPADKAYKPLNDIRIEIPTLGINYPIVGAAVSKNSWDLTWLRNSVAYLEGSAYPTLSGNTVLTAHVTDANNNLGPFSDIKGMQEGQQIYIHSGGMTYVYQVQQNRKILPANITAAFKHEEYNWVTLVTCEDYNAKTGLYKYRRMVRAVLISVVPEK